VVEVDMDLTSLTINLPERGNTSSEEKLKEEFKNAATAVTRLYKTVSNNESQLRREGYLQAVEDMLELLDEDPKIDIYEWLLQKRAGEDDVQLGKRRRNH
jgi:sensor domain CHASE-containing protein